MSVAESQEVRYFEGRQYLRGSNRKKCRCRNITTDEEIQIHKGQIEVGVQGQEPQTCQRADTLSSISLHKTSPYVPKCRPVDSGHVYSDVNKFETTSFFF